MIDIYIDPTLAYPDACVAASLAGPAGPCFYCLKPDMSAASSEMLENEIAPSVKATMGAQIARTLALPLLWAALEPIATSSQELISAGLKERIQKAFVNAGGSK